MALISSNSTLSTIDATENFTANHKSTPELPHLSNPPINAVANLTDPTMSMAASNITLVHPETFPILAELNTTLVQPNLPISLMDTNATLVPADPSPSLMDSNVNLVHSDPSPSLTNLNETPIQSDPSIFSMTSLESLVTSDFLPTQSATPQLINSNEIEYSHRSPSQWRTPSLAIGIGCLVFGFVCVIIGTILCIRAKRQSRRSTRRLNVMSGFDFNDGAEDDYQYNSWHKSQLAIGTNEKSGFDMDTPNAEYHNFRYSGATSHSQEHDDKVAESNDNLQPHIRVVTGFAQ